MSSYNNESKKRNIGTKEIALSGLLLSVAFICSNIKLAQMPMGGSVTMLSMVFISLIGYLFGVKIGLISALAYGFLQLSIEEKHNVYFNLNSPFSIFHSPF